jgi:hypothetical protein
MKRCLSLLAIGLFAFLPGCSDDDDDEGGTGILRVRLKDAPYPYSSIADASITVESVEVHVRGGFETLPVDGAPVDIDLLELQNGVTELLVDHVVPAGNLDQIRLILSSASVTLSDGRVFDLVVPSGETSGLKIFVAPPIAVVRDLTTELLLDFDVSQSFEPIPAAPNHVSEITGFHFHPVLKVVNVSEVGTVSGHVWNDAGTPSVTTDDTLIVGATVTATSSAALSSTTATGAQGEFRISGLEPGLLMLRAEAPGFSAVQIQTTVVVGNDIGGHEIRLTPLLDGKG